MKKFIYLVCFLFAVNTLTAQTYSGFAVGAPINCQSGTVALTTTTLNIQLFNPSTFCWQLEIEGLGGAWSISAVGSEASLTNNFNILAVGMGTYRVRLFPLTSPCPAPALAGGNLGATFTLFPTSTNITGGLDSTNVTCNGLNDGTATAANIFGGTTPAFYTYAWTATGTGNLGANLPTGASLTNLPPGIYICEITASALCPSLIDSVIITELNALTATSVPNNVLCFGDCSGSIN